MEDINPTKLHLKDYSLRAIFGWGDKSELSELSKLIRVMDQWDGQLESVPAQTVIKAVEVEILAEAQKLKPLRKKTRSLHESLLVLDRRKKKLGVWCILQGLKVKADKLPFVVLPDHFLSLFARTAADVQSGRKDPSENKWREFINAVFSYMEKVKSGGKWSSADEEVFSRHSNLLPSPLDTNIRAQVAEMVIATWVFSRKIDYPINHLRTFLAKALKIAGPDEGFERLKLVWDQNSKKKKKRIVEAAKKKRQRATLPKGKASKRVEKSARKAGRAKTKKTRRP